MDDNFSDYVDLSPQELASNESFQAYVFRQYDKDVLFWETFISKYPDKRRDVEEAAETLNLLAFRKNRTPDGLRESELKRLLSSIESAPESAPGETPHSAGRRILYNWGYKVAASLVGFLLVVSAAIYVSGRILKEGTITRQTAFGESSTFVLPDSSTVILNGNTTLTYKKGWNQGQLREVWLEGEAFFEVKHKGQSEATRFIVHTPDLSVEVLGTKFNVFNRDDFANVVLNSGKVKVKIASEKDTSSVLMIPDEAVEYSRRNKTITKRHVNAELLTSWRNNILVFDNTPLSRIKEIIEQTYGVKVILDSSVDESEKLVGTIPSENLDVLLKVLAKSSNLRITRHDGDIYITREEPVSAQP